MVFTCLLICKLHYLLIFRMCIILLFIFKNWIHLIWYYIFKSTHAPNHYLLCTVVSFCQFKYFSFNSDDFHLKKLFHWYQCCFTLKNYFIVISVALPTFVWLVHWFRIQLHIIKNQLNHLEVYRLTKPKRFCF